MEYPGEKNYDSNMAFRVPQGNGGFGSQSISSAFSVTNNRLGGFDGPYQHNRTSANSFDPAFAQSNGQQHPGNYNLGNGHGFITGHNNYESLHIGGTYDSSGIDWNTQGVRSLSGMDNRYNAPPQNAAIFNGVSGNQADWTGSLRATSGDSLGLNAAYGGVQGDLNHPMTVPPGNPNGGIVSLGQQQKLRPQQPPQQPFYGMMNPHSPRGSSSMNQGVHMPQSRGASNGPAYPVHPGTGGSNAQGRALNKMLLDILRDRNVDPNRLAMAIDANIERMDCVNLATLLFHTGKKRLLLTASFIKRIALRFNSLKEELRAREASNALYGLKCMSSECPEVRQLVLALASKVAVSHTELVAQAVGNALYGCQMMTSEHEEVRYLLSVLAVKVSQCTELLEAQNVGNALYGLRGMNSDCKEVRMLIAALTPKVATAREELNGQALGNSLYGLQGMNSREPEVRQLLAVLATKVSRTWEDLKAQEVGNALYGLKRMNSDVVEVRQLIAALGPKVATSPEVLDAQAIGNSFYGMQNMKSDNQPVLSLLSTMAEKVLESSAELDGQAMGNSLYGLQGMSSEKAEVRAVVNAITMKIQASCLEMNAQELGNALYGLQKMTSDHIEIRRLIVALTQKVSTSKHELTSQEIGNAIFGLQGMSSSLPETRLLVKQMATKIQQSTSLIDPQGIANSIFGLQRMTSDSEEVRCLLLVLASKIEQSWKLLSAQHISNSIFGLQGLSSNDMEVRTLVHALVPKVLASRDEMSPKQICNALYGLKNMSTSHDEVRSLLGPLTEKLNLCSEPIPLSHLASAFYGLQGMDTAYEEVNILVAALCEKLTFVDEIDVFSIGNILYGIQRMSTSSIEVVTLLELLSPMVATLADCHLEIGAPICSNILYGIQNCSANEETVRRILVVISNRIGEIMGPDPVNSTMSLHEAICLHQGLALTVPKIPDLQSHTTLYEDLVRLQTELLDIIESRKHELPPFQLSSLQRKLADAVNDLFEGEAFEITCGDTVYGFDVCIMIRLPGGVSLQTKDGEEWSPALNIELTGPNDLTPARALFLASRARYLQEERGVCVVNIPASTVANLSRKALCDFLYNSPDMFECLSPPTPEDNATFTSILVTMGYGRKTGILACLNPDSRPMASSSDPNNPSGGISFFSQGSVDILGGGMSSGSSNGILGDNLDYYESSLGIQFGQGETNRAMRLPLGASLGWIGDPPIGSASHTPAGTPCSSPTTMFPPTLPLAIAQRRLQSQNQGLNANVKTVVSSPMPPGYSSRIVNPPFVQIGLPTSNYGAPPIAAPTTPSAGSAYPKNMITQVMPGNSDRKQSANSNAYNSGAINNKIVGGNSTPGKPFGGMQDKTSYGLQPFIPNASISQAAVESRLDLSRSTSLSSLNSAPAADTTVRPDMARSQSNDSTLILMGESGMLSPVKAGSTDRASSVTSGNESPTNAEGTEVDSEIALIEAELEIKRLEAKLLSLKKKTQASTPGTSTSVASSGVAINPSNTDTTM